MGVQFKSDLLSKVHRISHGDGKDIKEGEIYYRYRGRTQVIRYPELRDIIDIRRREEQQLWLKHLKQIARIGVREAGIFDLNSGEVAGAGGTFVLDESLLDQLFFIREGEFSEKKGAPAVKIVGEAQVVGKSLLPSTQKIFKTKAIRTPDIVKAFLEGKKIDSPEEYLRQVCFESSGFLPVYHFLKQARLTRATGVKLLQKVQSTSQAKKKVIERLASDEDLSLPIPTDQHPAGRAKLAYRQLLIDQEIDLSDFADANSLKYLLQAIRTLEANRAKRKYVRELLLQIFNAHFGITRSLSGDIRHAMCFVDLVLNRSATDEA